MRINGNCHKGSLLLGRKPLNQHNYNDSCGFYKDILDGCDNDLFFSVLCRDDFEMEILSMDTVQ